MGGSRLFGRRSGPPDTEFRALYDETFTILFRIARRITNSDEAAEDMVHDSYIKAVERWDIFPTRNDAKYWLIRVVKNNALNWIKRKGREQNVYQRYFKENDDSSESPEEETLKSETIKDVQRYLDRLPEKFRVVLVLKEYGLLNYKEIGRILGITEGNVKVRVFRAREALAALLREDGKDVS
ncbi:MAG: RNA polymerase subunit sigma-24 [Spirochaetes bacterium RIFOXYC1_FULL_54_7]|nr:MAG: RNA polymerase subunit sigma-24 [Spirochaetes bacterium RIFOXYC1_FULL_54_7]